MNLLSAKGLAKATVACTVLTLVRRVRALNAPAAGVGLTRAIRTLGVVAHHPPLWNELSAFAGALPK